MKKINKLLVSANLIYIGLSGSYYAYAEDYKNSSNAKTADIKVAEEQKQANPKKSSHKSIKALKEDYKFSFDFKEIPFTESNLYSHEKHTLGKFLFFEPRLSGSKRTSCATCHSPMLGWGDGLPKGIGDRLNERPRKSQTLLNIAWDELFNWDGKTESLAKQAPNLIKNPDLMNMPIEKAVAFLDSNVTYKKMFESAFPKDKKAVTPENIGKAIEVYERTIVSKPAPFDKWIAGNEKAISKDAKDGFVIFNTKANCSACHSSWRFSDGSFHDIGLASKDEGRGKITPKIPAMKHAFKTPGLRNISSRAPYMHDGSLKTLSDVVDHYNNKFVSRPSLSSDIKPLNLTDVEKKKLIAFLETLSSDDKVVFPLLP